ncbi:MAG: hypothetical protein K2F79_05700, partial [Muribaculaceae bacterium]|nr:hypothetical protein [Muribaculaceae bacterium]
MNLAWKIFRTVVSVLLLMAVLIPTAIYVLLSLDGVQRTVKDVASSELSRILGAEVNIGRIAIHPFNRLGIEEMSLVLNSSDTVASISNVSARFELYHFIRTGEFVVDYALVAGASIHISRPEPGAPLNISPILEHLRSDKPKEDKPFELKINTVLLRNTSLTYDVVSAPMPAEGHFDPGHLNISDLALNAYIPHLS